MNTRWPALKSRKRRYPEVQFCLDREFWRYWELFEDTKKADGADLALLISDYGCISGCTYDLTGDGIVDADDLDEFALHYGDRRLGGYKAGKEIINHPS